LDYAEFAPPPDLAHVVKCAWTLRSEIEPRDVAEVLPDGHPELVLNFDAPMRHHPVDGAPEVQPPVILAGVITRPFHLSATGRSNLLGIRFQPAGARPIAPGAMRRLVDTWSEPADPSVWRAALPALRALPESARVDAGWAFLRERISVGYRPRNDRAVRAAALIVESGGECSVEQVALEVGIGARQLVRRFRDEVGVGPKLLARVVRFQRALRLMTGPGALPAARAAVSAGYADQAHMISDVSDFSGLSPKRLLAVSRPLADLFTDAELA
jgi:AraC-like DNA-binding protein